jgi:hypothetical protein
MKSESLFMNNDLMFDKKKGIVYENRVIVCENGLDFLKKSVIVYEQRFIVRKHRGYVACMEAMFVNNDAFFINNDAMLRAWRLCRALGDDVRKQRRHVACGAVMFVNNAAVLRARGLCLQTERRCWRRGGDDGDLLAAYAVRSALRPKRQKKWGVRVWS